MLNMADKITTPIASKNISLGHLWQPHCVLFYCTDGVVIHPRSAIFDSGNNIKHMYLQKRQIIQLGATGSSVFYN